MDIKNFIVIGLYIFLSIVSAICAIRMNQLKKTAMPSHKKMFSGYIICHTALALSLLYVAGSIFLGDYHYQMVFMPVLSVAAFIGIFSLF